MARPITKLSERGSTLIEGLPVLGVLVVLISGVLLASYLLWAQAWVHYQCEQAIYCGAETSTARVCERKVLAKLKAFLPWGETQIHINGQNSVWSAEVKWKFKNFGFTVHRRLTARDLRARAALRW